MDDATRRIADGLRQAVQAEIEGQHFYLMAAGSTSDAKGREVLEQLAAEELDHARFLRAQFDSMIANGELDRSAALGSRYDSEDRSPIFSEKLRSRAGEAHFEMTALAVGMQLEASAVTFYRGEASATDDPDVKKFYLELADWESGHHQLLARQQEYLQEDYWSANRFSPF
jgi:rubrerythrin